ncbi:LytR/AlgR family response regulator transcription factor [Pontibacter silvestris]|uniref:LytR/AlgR family response regulator transcription factor n=1 Tax=Pontibacter silvestris TaxID=2305183 RepID=A0ABW4X0S2_9BACT|nr:LytTR family DNA-binding domain-containing protein [Pontibacter silvestris]MCC9136094.1 LytTR family DNA-binding domain-containing protein [Pontibacter silvestris]
MKVVIIEDEPLTAEDLSDTLLQVDKSIQIEAVLTSVKNAISYFKDNAFPDLIFSDIQLGDGLSFEIFKAINTTTPVVFCTAYDEYALEAFKANGIDYILKPFTTASINATIHKIKQLQQRLSQKDTSYKDLYELFENKLARKKGSILVYQRDKIIPLPVKEIAICYVDNQITRAVCFDQRSYIVNHTLDELEDILGTPFFRANRQHLVNHEAVREASHYFGRKLVVNLTVPFQDDVIVSKAKSSSFLNWLAG